MGGRLSYLEYRGEVDRWRQRPGGPESACLASSPRFPSASDPVLGLGGPKKQEPEKWRKPGGKE